MKIKPLFDRVIVKETNISDNKSKLIMQASSEDKPLFGEILCVGDGINEDGKEIKMQLKKHDKVIFSKYCAVAIRIDGEELFVLRQSDILAILGETNE